MLIKTKEYQMYLMENEIAENTIKNYINTLTQFNDYLVSEGVEVVEKEHLINYKAMLREVEHAPGKKYKVSSINQKIICLNVYFNWETGDKNNPLKLKKFKEQTNNHKESINQSDFERLRRHANKEMDMFMMTIANTGLRISELCALKKSDLPKSLITITNKGKDRTIDIPPFLKKKLIAWDHVKKLNDNDFIFGKTQQHYRSELKKIAGKAKVNKAKVYPHSFRHYFAKQFISVIKGDSSDLQQMLGHSSIATTTIYTRKNKEELASLYKGIRIE